MKHLIRKIINEIKKDNQSEIDRILDKINEKGIDSLTRGERMVLNSSEKENYSSKEEIIDLIKNKTSECGLITTQDLYMDSDILIDDSSQGIHLIDGFHYDGVNVSIYGGYKNETIMDEYEIPYEKLDTDILEEILSLVENYECE